MQVFAIIAPTYHLPHTTKNLSDRSYSLVPLYY